MSNPPSSALRNDTVVRNEYCCAVRMILQCGVFRLGLSRTKWLMSQFTQPPTSLLPSFLLTLLPRPPQDDPAPR